MKTKKKEYNTVEIKGEFAQLLKDIQKQNKQKDTEIKQLKKDIKLWKVISEGIDFDDLKKICDLERQNISLKQQLADIEKDYLKLKQDKDSVKGLLLSALAIISEVEDEN